jgi:hypothetical protein
MEAFAKSDDERDFILDRQEGFLLFIDLDKPQADLDLLFDEMSRNSERYVLVPKLTFYETKKIMEGFVNEKVYDIDTKEKLLEIISSKEARENFLEFIYDHHSEMEKWQQYYIERSRIRIIEWLRTNQFEFVFEEDLDLSRETVEKLKINLFEPKVSKDIDQSRKALFIKAKTYYSNEALNTRPKRGRPPKQVQKAEVEKEVSIDIFTTIPGGMRPFLFSPEITANHAATFSSRFESEDDLLQRKRKSPESDQDLTVEALNRKLSELRSLSSRWLKTDEEAPRPQQEANKKRSLPPPPPAPLPKRAAKPEVKKPESKKHLRHLAPTKSASKQGFKPVKKKR